MKFKAKMSSVHENAFIENSVALPGGEKVCFIDDFQEREGYVKLTNKEIEFCLEATKRPWLSLVEKTTNAITRLKQSFIDDLTKPDDDSWECLVLDAKEFRTSKYKASLTPPEISKMMREQDKPAKEIVAQIIKQDKAINDKVLSIKKLALTSINSIELNTPDAELEKIYLNFLKKLK